MNQLGWGLLLWTLATLLVCRVSLAAEELPEGPQRFSTTAPLPQQLKAFRLNPSGRAGTYLRLSARVSAVGVSVGPNPWNGVKVMLKVESDSGTAWPQLTLPSGTYSDRTVTRRVFVPNDLRALTLILGLEQVTGSVLIDQIQVTADGQPPDVSLPDALAPLETGHSALRLRGAMTSPQATRQDLAVLAQWGANLIRWQLIRPAHQSRDLDRWDADMERLLAKTDQVLVWAKELGLRVVLDLHSPPGGDDTEGGYQAATGGFFTNPKAQGLFVEFWKKVAQRYRDDKNIWGFDLANEPDDEAFDDREGCVDWQALAERTAKAVRLIDPRRVLIVEPADWGSARGFLRFRPLPLEGIVYSFHDYSPQAFTHQGVFRASPLVSYPGMIAGQHWDQAALSRVLDPAREWSRKYRKALYVGEFGAVRWAPGAATWFRDQIALFEAEGWDWSYHAFREWQGWSLEEGGHDRLDVIRQAFSQEQE